MKIYTDIALLPNILLYKSWLVLMTNDSMLV